MQVSVILACEGLKVRLLLGAPRELSPPRLRLRSELDPAYPSAAPSHARFHPETLVFLDFLLQRNRNRARSLQWFL